MRSLSGYTTDHNHEDWFLWESGKTLFELSEREVQENPSEHLQKRSQVSAAVPAINRQQYNAILQRLNHASRHAGTYAAWNC